VGLEQLGQVERLDRLAGTGKKDRLVSWVCKVTPASPDQRELLEHEDLTDLQDSEVVQGSKVSERQQLVLLVFSRLQML